MYFFIFYLGAFLPTFGISRNFAQEETSQLFFFYNYIYFFLSTLKTILTTLKLLVSIYYTLILATWTIHDKRVDNSNTYLGHKKQKASSTHENSSKREHLRRSNPMYQQISAKKTKGKKKFKAVWSAQLLLLPRYLFSLIITKWSSFPPKLQKLWNFKSSVIQHVTSEKILASNMPFARIFLNVFLLRFAYYW